MDIEKLEKLAKLKENGILTQKEFNAEKKKLLQSETSKTTSEEMKTKQRKSKLAKEVDVVSNNIQREKINWKNFGLSFLYAVLFFILYVVGVFCLERVFPNPENGIFIQTSMFFICFILIVSLAYKFETHEYQNCPSILGMFFLCLVIVRVIGGFGPVSCCVIAWMFIYDILQIKDGIRLLKSNQIKQKMSPIPLLIWLLALLACIYFSFAVDFSHLKRNQMVDILKCDNVQVQQTEIIPMINQSFSQYGIKMLALSNEREISFNSENGSRVCQAIASFSNGEKALIEYAFISKDRENYTKNFRIVDTVR